MAISNTIKHKGLGEFCLDPENPRLGRQNSTRQTKQSRVLELMQSFSLEEIAVSFIENKQFWPQEALIVVKEKLYGKDKLVVVEGNRRLAALISLSDAMAGDSKGRKWTELSEQADEAGITGEFFAKIPYLLADSREDVDAFLGFRHVTGIKQWGATEKSEYIARLIEKKGMTFVEVMRAIGSRTDPVRRNYVAHRILKQLEEIDDERVSLEHIEDKFSVLFLSLREKGVQEFLGIELLEISENQKKPVSSKKLQELADFASWLFGSEKSPPLFTDSRNVGKFAKVLRSGKAVKYLRSTQRPSFDLAIQKAGVDEGELVDRIQSATDEIEQALGRVHLHLQSDEIENAVKRFGLGAIELIRKFPDISEELLGDENA